MNRSEIIKMAILGLNQQGIYNHSDLIINPPSITNTPLYDYMKEQKMLLSDTFGTKPYANTYNVNHKDTDRFISALYVSTVASFGIYFHNGYKKIKKFLIK